MAECIITMKSVTYAEKAKRIARSAGFHGTVINVDPSVTKRGCAYGISLPCRDAAELVILLQRRNIPYGEIMGDIIK